MFFIYLVIIAILIYIDQRTKITVERRYEKGGALAKKTKNFLYEIIYTRNYGVALNVLERKAKLIIVINSCILAVLCVYTSFVVWKYSWDFQLVALILIISGGIGNLIDRVKEGYVIDFIRFNFRKSPIFNIADFYIIIGEILFCFGLLYKYKQNLKFLEKLL